MFLKVREKYRDQFEAFRDFARAINGLLDGKSNNTGEFTLTASATSTTVTNERVGANSVVLLQPTTANAATAISTTYIDKANYVAGTSFEVTHANNSQTDRTFYYEIIG